VTTAGKLFTIFFGIMGIGVLLALLSAIASQLRRQSFLHRPLARFAARRGEEAEPELLVATANGAYDVS
jgi:hypothetical protein